MGRYVIGDIHGCAAEVSRLLESLPLAQGDRLVELRVMDLEANDEEAQIFYDFLQ
mgnify:CR=1 FL=1